jgi:hypothetical protein
MGGLEHRGIKILYIFAIIPFPNIAEASWEPLCDATKNTFFERLALSCVSGIDSVIPRIYYEERKKERTLCFGCHHSRLSQTHCPV